MPGWHKATQQLQRSGKFKMVGLIQEQHPDRCTLFMQWKKMKWPIMVDALNLLDVAAVPITVAIDEYGVVRGVLGRRDIRDTLKAELLDATFEKPAGWKRGRAKKPNLARLKKLAGAGNSSQPWRDYADALVMWGGDKRLDEAVDTYIKAMIAEPADGRTHFRLGVAYRRRYESEHRRPDDFKNALKSWTAALDANPNQYIWRRRIQQYGPRLDKPYPFYDWVHQARKEITAAGRKPVELAVEPGGAEFAHRIRSFESQTAPRSEPDAAGRIQRDAKLIHLETAVAPAVMKPGASVRVHVIFRPDKKADAHWNNEVEGLAMWINPPQGWQVDKQYLSLDNPTKSAVSTEPRKIEFELKSPDGVEPGSVVIPAYALYYVCEGAGGTCVYRRQDVELHIEIQQTRW